MKTQEAENLDMQESPDGDLAYKDDRTLFLSFKRKHLRLRLTEDVVVIFSSIITPICALLLDAPTMYIAVLRDEELLEKRKFSFLSAAGKHKLKRFAPEGGRKQVAGQASQ